MDKFRNKEDVDKRIKLKHESLYSVIHFQSTIAGESNYLAKVITVKNNDIDSIT
jgi:hypothetical protein